MLLLAPSSQQAAARSLPAQQRAQLRDPARKLFRGLVFNNKGFETPHERKGGAGGDLLGEWNESLSLPHGEIVTFLNWKTVAEGVDSTCSFSKALSSVAYLCFSFPTDMWKFWDVGKRRIDEHWRAGAHGSSQERNIFRLQTGSTSASHAVIFVIAAAHNWLWCFITQWDNNRNYDLETPSRAFESDSGGRAEGLRLLLQAARATAQAEEG
jgi:hypothetical protein